MSVIAYNIEQVFSWSKLSYQDKNAIKPYLLNANTVIVPIKKNIVHKNIMGKNQTTLGIRIPHDDFCKKLSKKYMLPITTTSVNLTGTPPINNPKKIYLHYKNKVDLLIDNGTLANSSGSKIYEIEKSTIINIR